MFTRIQPLILFVLIAFMMMVQDALAFQSIAPRGDTPPGAAAIKMLETLERERSELEASVESFRNKARDM